MVPALTTLVGGVCIRRSVDVLGRVPIEDILRPVLVVRETLMLRLTTEFLILLALEVWGRMLLLVLDIRMEEFRVDCEDFLSRLRVKVALAPGFILRGISPLDIRLMECLMGDVVMVPDVPSFEVPACAEVFLAEVGRVRDVCDFDFTDFLSGVPEVVARCIRLLVGFVAPSLSSGDLVSGEAPRRGDFPLVVGSGLALDEETGEAGALNFLSRPLARRLDRAGAPFESVIARLELAFALPEEFDETLVGVDFRPLERAPVPLTRLELGVGVLLELGGVLVVHGGESRDSDLGLFMDDWGLGGRAAVKDVRWLEGVRSIGREGVRSIGSLVSLFDAGVKVRGVRTDVGVLADGRVLRFVVMLCCFLGVELGNAVRLPLC